MIEQDVLMVRDLLREHLKAFHLSPVLTQEDVQHWLLPQDSVVDTYVVEVSIIQSSHIYSTGKHTEVFPMCLDQ